MLRFTIKSLSLLMLATTICYSSIAKKRTSAAAKPTVLSATVRRTIPGVPTMPPVTHWSLVFIWNEKKPPTSLLWSTSEKKWLTCVTSRVHNFPGTSAEGVKAYESETVMLTEIRQGDTLELIPIPEKAAKKPGPVRAGQPNTLYYKVNGSLQWQSIGLELHREKDIVMP